MNKNSSKLGFFCKRNKKPPPTSDTQAPIYDNGAVFRQQFETEIGEIRSCVTLAMMRRKNTKIKNSPGAVSHFSIDMFILNGKHYDTDAKTFAVNAQGMEYGPWNISYDVSRILPSICSTKVVCEKDDDQFCQFCVYSKELSIPHFPDMVFPNNILTLSHKSGLRISFTPLDALKRVAATVEAIEVACAAEWLESRPEAEKKKRPFDWTFSTDYKGTITGDVIVEPTEEEIDLELLKRKDQILFYNDITLFEDELHDHGISVLSVKIRVMPNYWYVLLRYFLRVDDVMSRANETRMFHSLNSNYILREYTAREAKVQDLKIPTYQMKDPNELIPLLPLKEKVLEKLLIKKDDG